MSESSLPIDHAWSVVRRDPDKIEKVLPLAVPIAFGGLGAFTGTGGRFVNPETGRLDPGIYEDAAVYDPITGAVKVADLGDSPLDRVTGFGTGALQGVNPMTYLGYAGRGLSAAGKGIRTSDRFADTVRVADGVTDTTAGPMQVLGQGAGKRIEGAGQGVERFAASRPARVAGRFGQAAGNAFAQLGSAGLAPFIPFVSQLGSVQDNESGFGQQGQTQGFGSGGLGINDISNVQSNAVAGRQIFNPGAYKNDPRAVSFEEQREFGGFGMTKGENMFVNNTGEEIRKQVEELMDKAHCTSELKADEDKKSKKPAHGMVIVIGSKAGPGPSKNGKRQKLDSEKKED